jgi:hypothetical protein
MNEFLAFPGLLAVSPLIVGGLAFDRVWVSRVATTLGAAFFWYSVGCYVDCFRLDENARPHRLVRAYISALFYLSAVLFPFIALAGTRVGNHACIVGAPPAWADLLGYGIVMFWVTLGTFFAWRRFQNHLPPASFSLLAASKLNGYRGAI